MISFLFYYFYIILLFEENDMPIRRFLIEKNNANSLFSTYLINARIKRGTLVDSPDRKIYLEDVNGRHRVRSCSQKSMQNYANLSKTT